jgi:hypothetical protein
MFDSFLKHTYDAAGRVYPSMARRRMKHSLKMAERKVSLAAVMADKGRLSSAGIAILENSHMEIAAAVIMWAALLGAGHLPLQRGQF